MPPESPEEQENWQKQKDADLDAEREKHQEMRTSTDDNRLDGGSDRAEEQGLPPEPAAPVTDQSATAPVEEHRVVEETKVEETTVEGGNQPATQTQEGTQIGGGTPTPSGDVD